MPFAARMTVNSAYAVSPLLGLRTATDDATDVAAGRFKERMLMRIDPRDVRRTADNPTGRKRVHYMAPNRDPLLFRGSGVSIGTVAGGYGGAEVFKMTRGGTAAAGTSNDLTMINKSLENVTEFSIFGVAHFDAAMLGQAGIKPLIAMYRDGSTVESALTHQFASGVNYLTIYGDLGDGSGLNHNIDTSTAVAVGVPFAFMWRVKTAGPRQSLFVNQLTTETIGGAGTTPEAGKIEVKLGFSPGNDATQWSGGLWRAYVVSGDALDTADNQAISTELMLEMKAACGIA